MDKSYNGSYQQFDVVCKHDVMVPAQDGIRLATDIYFPAHGKRQIDEAAPVILERTPYDKRSPGNVTNGKYFARRGYICAIQDVRGRFKSEGDWYPFAQEASDGYDTIEWLSLQQWSEGSVGTMGASYAGSTQCSLATLDPPHLTTMIIAVGPSNYYHSSMRHNGTLEQRFLIYVFRMAVTSKEAQADPTLRARLHNAFTNQMPEIVNQFPLKKGTTILRMLPSYEQWAIDIATHGNYDKYWKQRGYAVSEYYEEHADVPTLYLGGWYDSYARNTCESYVSLNKIKKSPQHLIMGPWTHGNFHETYSGDIDFGIGSHIDYNDLRLAWFDHHLKGLQTEVTNWSPVHIFTMGTGNQMRNRHDNNARINYGGYWRSKSNWPIPDTNYTPYYLHTGGYLALEPPSNQTSSSTTSFTFNPKNPVPTFGGGISAADTVIKPGAFDQVGRSDFHGSNDPLPLNTRDDVISFQSTPLETDLEVTGPVKMRLWAASSALDTDFTAKLINVIPPNNDYPEGLAINITDSIIRARYRNSWETPELLTPEQAYELIFELYPTSNIFRRGHQIRLDISSSNWPRFDINPNTGGPLGLERSYKIAQQIIFHDAKHPSCIILPLQMR